MLLVLMLVIVLVVVVVVVLEVMVVMVVVMVVAVFVVIVSRLHDLDDPQKCPWALWFFIVAKVMEQLCFTSSRWSRAILFQNLCDCRVGRLVTLSRQSLRQFSVPRGFPGIGRGREELNLNRAVRQPNTSQRKGRVYICWCVSGRIKKLVVICKVPDLKQNVDEQWRGYGQYEKSWPYDLELLSQV
jgi:hypothetical protein